MFRRLDWLSSLIQMQRMTFCVMHWCCQSACLDWRCFFLGQYTVVGCWKKDFSDKVSKWKNRGRVGVCPDWGLWSDQSSNDKKNSDGNLILMYLDFDNLVSSSEHLPLYLYLLLWLGHGCGMGTTTAMGWESISFFLFTSHISWWDLDGVDNEWLTNWTMTKL